MDNIIITGKSNFAQIRLILLANLNLSNISDDRIGNYVVQAVF